MDFKILTDKLIDDYTDAVIESPFVKIDKIKNNPMFVINSDDKIEYVAASPAIVKSELDKLFHDIDLLQRTNLNSFEILY